LYALAKRKPEGEMQREVVPNQATNFFTTAE